MSSVMLLSVVPTIVAGTTGTIVAEGLTTVSLHYALLTTLVGGALIGLGLTMSAVILFVFMMRLILYGYPPEGDLLTRIVLPSP